MNLKLLLDSSRWKRLATLIVIVTALLLLVVLLVVWSRPADKVGAWIPRELGEAKLPLIAEREKRQIAASSKGLWFADADGCVFHTTGEGAPIKISWNCDAGIRIFSSVEAEIAVVVNSTAAIVANTDGWHRLLPGLESGGIDPPRIEDVAIRGGRVAIATGDGVFFQTYVGSDAGLRQEGRSLKGRSVAAVVLDERLRTWAATEHEILSECPSGTPCPPGTIVDSDTNWRSVTTSSDIAVNAGLARFIDLEWTGTYLWALRSTVADEKPSEPLLIEQKDSTVRKPSTDVGVYYTLAVGETGLALSSEGGVLKVTERGGLLGLEVVRLSPLPDRPPGIERRIVGAVASPNRGASMWVALDGRYLARYSDSGEVLDVYPRWPESQSRKLAVNPDDGTEEAPTPEGEGNQASGLILGIESGSQSIWVVKEDGLMELIPSARITADLHCLSDPWSVINICYDGAKTSNSGYKPPVGAPTGDLQVAWVEGCSEPDLGQLQDSAGWDEFDKFKVPAVPIALCRWLVLRDKAGNMTARRLELVVDGRVGVGGMLIALLTMILTWLRRGSSAPSQPEDRK